MASLGLGAFALLTCFCCGLFTTPFSLGAVVLGIVSLMRINKEPDRYGGKPLAIAGIAVGSVALVMTLVLTVIGVGANLAQNM
jgi:hypothetical protein